MKTQRLAIVLTIVNLVLLVFTATRTERATAETVLPTLRGGALELMDDGGQVRSRINVESSGEVVLRLFDQQGTIRVKLGAGSDGAGFLLLDEATEPAIQMIARRIGTAEKPATTNITLRSTGGRQRAITPCRVTKQCGRRS